jgi:hypothetical protein
VEFRADEATLRWNVGRRAGWREDGSAAAVIAIRHPGQTRGMPSMHRRMLPAIFCAPAALRRVRRIPIP